MSDPNHVGVHLNAVNMATNESSRRSVEFLDFLGSISREI